MVCDKLIKPNGMQGTEVKMNKMGIKSRERSEIEE